MAATLQELLPPEVVQRIVERMRKRLRSDSYFWKELGSATPLHPIAKCGIAPAECWPVNEADEPIVVDARTCNE